MADQKAAHQRWQRGPERTCPCAAILYPTEETSVRSVLSDKRTPAADQVAQSANVRAREEFLSLLGPDLGYNGLVNRVSSSPKTGESVRRRGLVQG